MGKVRPRCFAADAIEKSELTRISMILGDSRKTRRKAVCEWRRALEDVLNKFWQQSLANDAVETSLDVGDSHVNPKRRLPKTFFARFMNIYLNLTFEAKKSFAIPLRTPF